MANYADILNVLCLYSHSLRGSTVLQLHRDCVIVCPSISFITVHRLTDVTCNADQLIHSVDVVYI